MSEKVFKTPIDQATDMTKPTTIGGKIVSLKSGGNGYLFEGDKYAHILHPTLEEAKKHYATAESGRMAAWKGQNRMPPLRYSPVIVKQPDGDGFMVLELGDMHRYGLQPFKEEPKAKQENPLDEPNFDILHPTKAQREALAKLPRFNLNPSNPYKK